MSWFSKESKRKKKESRQKEEIFMRNGAILLKELIASSKGKYNQFRGFTDKEIELATNNYDERKIIRDNGNYLLYKGFLQDRPISVLKYKSGFLYPNEDGINSIVFASQMRHKNILKLIGCCLETELLALVFESVEYGTLADRIYGSCQQHFEPLSLTHRLKIAMDIANAIAYVHCGFPRPIVFRTIKPLSIVFDEQNVAKLFDFSLSMSIPEGETHIEGETEVGTPVSVYISPDYVESGKFNEKLDVYCFGILLLELLTGQKVFDLFGDDWFTEIIDPIIVGTQLSPEEEQVFDSSPEEEQVFDSSPDLSHHVQKYIEQNRFIEIIDPIIVGTELSPETEQQLQAFTELALKCLSKVAEERPTMIDVAKELRKMYKSSC